MVLEGHQIIETYEGNRITINEGEIVFLPRGVYYVSDLVAKQNFKVLLFYFDDLIIQEFLSDINLKHIYRISTPDHLLFGNVPKIETFVEGLLEIYKGSISRNKSFLNIKILELLHLLNTLVSEQAFADFLFRLTLPKKRNIKTFMEQNFDKPMKVEDYAYLTGRSVSKFRRDFKSSFDMTPLQWLKEKRMHKAVDLIKHRNISVTELSFEVGYENISYFIKEFKSFTGQSPKQY
ncbi:MAG: AraC family transcriptional regulator, partial [Bacteroidota bacterium]